MALIMAVSATQGVRMDSLNLVAKNMVVSFHYTLKDKEGQVLESSSGSEPLAYLHGFGQIVSGLESALLGKAPGAQFTVLVEAKDGYGVREDQLVISVGKSEWTLPDTVGVGEIIELQSPEGHVIPARIVEMNDQSVVLDANHPLAGEDLHFDVELISVRAATAEELAHGHAHGVGGHQH
jgi:FKBP-type peptidyl-prolyl cis-trans isomerase SlyD